MLYCGQYYNNTCLYLPLCPFRNCKSMKFCVDLEESSSVLWKIPILVSNWKRGRWVWGERINQVMGLLMAFVFLWENYKTFSTWSLLIGFIRSFSPSYTRFLVKICWLICVCHLFWAMKEFLSSCHHHLTDNLDEMLVSWKSYFRTGTMWCSFIIVRIVYCRCKSQRKIYCAVLPLYSEYILHM